MRGIVLREPESAFLFFPGIKVCRTSFDMLYISIEILNVQFMCVCLAVRFSVVARLDEIPVSFLFPSSFH